MLELLFNMKYRDELIRAMDMLGQHDNTIFLGQSVEVEGTAMFGTLNNVPMEKRLEMPVCEEMQAGMANGLALSGMVPISIFPRWNFLLLAANQIVNHLDKIPDFSTYVPKVIIRVGIGSERPLHPQFQHVGDFTDAFKLMCKNINVVRLDEPEQIYPAYTEAYMRQDRVSTILVEWSDYYNEK